MLVFRCRPVWMPCSRRGCFFGFLLALVMALAHDAGAIEGAGECTAERLSSIAGSRLHIESVTSVSAAGPVGAHCAVAGYIEHGTRIGVTLGLPEQWNGKFLFLGVGGFAGVTAPLQGGIARGYATASTDTGHKAASVEDAAWALNNPAGIINHYESSVEIATAALKQLTSAYYRTLPAHSYFQGCSAGGRQGIVQAQRFPASFDGIIAEAPAWSYSKLLITFIENARQILKSPDNWLPPEAFPQIDRVVLKQCDESDGVEDGIIEDPRRCKPDLRELLCKSGTRSVTCLTPAQIRILTRLQGAAFAAGRPGYYGYYLTGSDRSDLSWGWSEWFFGTRQPSPDASGQLSFAPDVLPPGADRGKGPNQFILGEQFFRYFVMSDPRYDAREFNIARDEQTLRHRLGGVLDADQTNLGPFVRSGGKLLIWHGWSDPAIPPEMAIELYTRILQSTPRYLNGDPLDRSVRLFMVPGMQHCGGGTGLTDFDALAAMEQWVEQGQAPDRIVAWQRVAGQRARSRPLCPYPQTPHFRGSGNSDDAANFDCR
jgi:feruloyl esterase